MNYMGGMWGTNGTWGAECAKVIVKIFQTNQFTTDHFINSKLVTLLSYQLSSVCPFVFVS
jgi:hypothetical protein